ncbi:MAG: hypothetical protein FJ083_06275 [Cyanobacteria bacterium K_Offshore_surface_m2_239]|nr:hypothetical protein [Cyanobacteria bacterium K_Offshore_surface_m2_239]
MANLQVPSVFPNIRSAISASSTGDSIVIAPGTFDVTAFPAAGGAPATLSYTNPASNIFSITGFTNVTSLSYQGSGRSGASSGGTTLSGNARFYVSNQDGGALGNPISVSYSGFEALYSNPSSNYIFSTGIAGNTSNNVNGNTVASSKTKTVSINNIQFSGTHRGNAGAAGNYIDVAGIQNFTFSNNIVNLTGQSGFTGSQAVSGGSSVVLVQGGQTGSVNISGNTFNESGYRNGFSVYDSTNVTISSNTFSRSAATSFVRTNSSGVPKSNKVANSTNVTIGGTISTAGNTFNNGSFLALEGGSGTVRFNTFNGTNMAALSSGAIGIYLEGSPAPNYNFTNNTFRYVSPFVNATSSPVYVTTNGTNDNTFVNPNNGNSAAIQQFITGTTGNDVLTSTLSTSATNRRDFIAGGLGNDTLDGGVAGPGTPPPAADSDFFLFNTTPNATTNVDTIINWTASNAAAYQRDQLVLDRKIFKGLTVTSSVSGNAALGIGQLAATSGSTGAGGQVISNPNGTFTSSTSAERIALATGGSAPGTLYYQAGDGSAAVPFARISTGTVGSGAWVTSLAQLGAIAVI